MTKHGIIIEIVIIILSISVMISGILLTDFLRHKND